MRSDPYTVAKKFIEFQRVRGVEKVFIFPRDAVLESEDDFQKNLGNLLFVLSETLSNKILIQTLKGKIAIYVTETFILGVILHKDANTILIEMNLARMAVTLEKCFKNYKADRGALQGKVQKRIEGLLPTHTIRTSAVTLISHELEVEGEIKLAVKPHVEEESLKKKVQIILNEEIPFFCTKHISIEIKTRFSGLLNIEGLTRQHLSKVIHKIQGI